MMFPPVQLNVPVTTFVPRKYPPLKLKLVIGTVPTLKMRHPSNTVVLFAGAVQGIVPLTPIGVAAKVPLRAADALPAAWQSPHFGGNPLFCRQITSNGNLFRYRMPRVEYSID